MNRRKGNEAQRAKKKPIEQETSTRLGEESRKKYLTQRDNKVKAEGQKATQTPRSTKRREHTLRKANREATILTHPPTTPLGYQNTKLEKPEITTQKGEYTLKQGYQCRGKYPRRRERERTHRMSKK